MSEKSIAIMPPVVRAIDPYEIQLDDNLFTALDKLITCHFPAHATRDTVSVLQTDFQSLTNIISFFEDIKAFRIVKLNPIELDDFEAGDIWIMRVREGNISLYFLRENDAWVCIEP